MWHMRRRIHVSTVRRRNRERDKEEEKREREEQRDPKREGEEERERRERERDREREKPVCFVYVCDTHVCAEFHWCTRTCTEKRWFSSFSSVSQTWKSRVCKYLQRRTLGISPLPKILKIQFPSTCTHVSLSCLCRRCHKFSNISAYIYSFFSFLFRSHKFSKFSALVYRLDCRIHNT